MILIMTGLSFLCEKKILARLKKNNICINVFCYENQLNFPIYISDQEFKISMDLLLVMNENKSHYVHIKDWQIYVSQNKEQKQKKFLQCFSSKYTLTEQKTPVPFKIYADSECNLGSVESYDGSYSKRYLRSHSLQFCLQACLC